MAILPRAEIIQPGDSVQLLSSWYNSAGMLSDTDSFPIITVIQPSGNVVLGPTSAGVFKLSTGVYGFILPVGLQPDIGVWADIWEGSIAGNVTVQEKNFTVFLSQLPSINSDGYESLGDDNGFNYSQTAIHNINTLLKMLRARLKSAGKRRSTDGYGNVVYTDCDIYSVDELVTFLAWALAELNGIPHFTFFTFDDTPIIENFAGILVQGATLVALSSQALIERGREFAITDNGIGFTPPTISELLNSQWGTEFTNWWEQVKYIKANMKPWPLGLGVLSNISVAPAISRLRHLKARRIL